MQQLQKRLATISTAHAALIFLLVGLLVVFYGYGVTQGQWHWHRFVDQLYSNLGIELVSISLTVLVIDGLNQRRHDRERKEELILQMGSPDKAFAVEAVRIIEQKGWLSDGSLEKAYLRGTNLSDANLSSADLHGAVLVESNLECVILMEADLHGAGLVDANLAGAVLSNVNLQDARLGKANLEDADLFEANLQCARLWSANLRGANLGSANLRDASLVDANLENADLTAANLSCADLSKANLKSACLDEIIVDNNTKLPDGTFWTLATDLTRFTNPDHAKFWRCEKPDSPAYRAN